MEKLKEMDERARTSLSRILFGLESPSPVSKNTVELEAEIGKIEFYDPTLNDSQKEAIRFALASREVALIHGPPGVRPTVLGSMARLTWTRQAKHTRSLS